MMADSQPASAIHQERYLRLESQVNLKETFPMPDKPTLFVTFVRHGESMDNLRSAWAGWKDASLSVHGMNQAQAVGDSFSTTHFTAIYASPLKRAYTTAQAIHAKQPEPKPTFSTSLLIREQHFGVAEGRPWIWDMKPGLSLEEHFAQGLYPVLHGRTDRFPEGESLEDVAVRANQAILDLVMPHVWTAAREGAKNVHIALVSHGICISELVASLLAKDASGQDPGHKYRGLLNTAWTRVAVDVKGSQEGEPMKFFDHNLPALQMTLTDFNRSEHLNRVKRQKGGIGSSAYDTKQKDIRAFFGGGATEATNEEGRSDSNAEDEANVKIKGD